MYCKQTGYLYVPGMVGRRAGRVAVEGTLGKAAAAATDETNINHSFT